MHTDSRLDVVTSAPLGRPTINPYREAAHAILHRLRWDLTLASWRSRRSLRSVRNRYLGKRAVIVCNGPSLLRSDLTLLDDVFTFGLNKINLLFNRSSFRPSCIVAVNPLVIEQNASFFRDTDTPLYLDSVGRAHVPRRENVAFLHAASALRFARDCSISICQGHTVTYVAMQLAFHMGFSEVALIGCDHEFVTKGEPNRTVVSGSNDPNHFDPRYFAGGVQWQLPDLAMSEVVYRLARDVYAAAGRRLVNATVGGKLEIFPRVSLEEFVRTPGH